MTRRPHLPAALRLALLLALVLGGLGVLVNTRRADPSAGQEQALQLAGALDAENILEQTFTPTRDGLSAVEVFARVPPGRLDARYTLTLSLRQAGSGEELANKRLTLVDARSHPRITFTFPPQGDSAGQAYLLRVESNAPADTVSLLSSREDIDPGGELRINGEPTGRDLTLRVFTALLPRDLLAGLARFAPAYALLLLVTLALALTGASVLVLLGTWPGEDLGERALWAVGLGVSAALVLFLLLGRSALWGMALLLLLALARLGLHRSITKNAPPRLPRLSAVDAGLLAVFLFALAVRLLQVQDVPVPMWTDGLDHWQMARRIIEAGRMPQGLLYHIGYHSLAVMFAEASGAPLHRALLLFGQWISALNGPALYVLAVRLFPRRARCAALLAALVLSGFPSLPGYLINWGRYPFLLGLTLLPFTLAALMEAVRPATGRELARRLGLLALLLVGQFLCHYGTLSFWLSFGMVLLAVDRPAWLRRLRLGRVMSGLAGLFALLAALVWLRFGADILEELAETVAQSRQTAGELSISEILQISLRAGGVWAWTAGALGVVWSAFAARRALALSAGWFAAQAVLIAAQAPLLGYALASYANLLIALALPLSLLAGGLLAGLWDAVPNRTWQGLAFLALLLGGLSQVGILNPTTLLFGPADAAAAQWITENTPPDSRFLINSAQWMGQMVPSDGGGWIEATTGRATIYIDEQPPHDHLKDLLLAQPVDYIYVGRFPGLLSRGELLSIADYLIPVYARSGITLYKVLPGE